MTSTNCRKRGLILLIAMGFLVNMLLFLAPSPVSAVVLKYATILPQNGPGAEELRTLMKKILRETKGEINFQMFGDAIAGDETEVIRRMESNRIQLAALSGVGLGKILPSFRVLEAPGLFRNYTEEDLVKREMFDVFAADFADRGYILLGLGGAGFVHAYSKQDISTAGSFKNLKMWTWKGDPLSHICIQEFGMEVLPMNITDVNNGLETGIIDAFYAPALAATSFQWSWKINHVLDYPLTSVSGAMIMVKKTFDHLSPQSQEILRGEIRAFSDEGVYLMRERNVQSMKLMRERGLNIVRPTREQVDIMEKAFARTIQKQIAMSIFPEKLYHQIRKILEKHRYTNDIPNYTIESEEIPTWAIP